jgi:flagellar hook protein FlgE
MKTHQFGIDVWSANITAVNTAGFKSSTPEFSSIYNTTLANSYNDPSSNDIGLGSTGQTTATDFSHGSVVETSNKYDLAINGDGWFSVVDSIGENFYTRAGNFQKDRDGNLVDTNGNYVLGTSANNFVNDVGVKNPKNSIESTKAGTQTKIHLPDTLTAPPEPTTKVDFTGNLNSTVKTELSAVTGKEEEIANKEVFRTAIYDSDGNLNNLEIKFTKVIPQESTGTTWKAVATLSDQDKNPISTSEGELNFNGRGALVSNTLTSIDNKGVQTAINFGDIYDQSKPNSGFGGVVSMHEFSGERKATKDGSKAGKLKDFGINSDGTIVATFDNGRAIPVSKIAIYNFQNEQGLEQSNPIYFKETANSGKARFFTDKEGKFIQGATVSSNKLEMSNVDLNTALTELIIMQKAYDASSKSITTSDELIQNAINMKK